MDGEPFTLVPWLNSFRFVITLETETVWNSVDE